MLLLLLLVHTFWLEFGGSVVISSYLALRPFYLATSLLLAAVEKLCFLPGDVLQLQRRVGAVAYRTAAGATLPEAIKTRPSLWRDSRLVVAFCVGFALGMIERREIEKRVIFEFRRIIRQEWQNF